MFQLHTAVNSTALYGDGTCIADPLAMRLLEFLIVYLACGAPFAVERLLGPANCSIFLKGVSAAVCLIIWPADSVLKLSRVLNSSFVSTVNSSDTNIFVYSTADSAAKRRELNCLMSRAKQDHDLGRFKELLERYSGLAALRTDISDCTIHTTPEVIRVSGHPAPQTAAACFNRRNLAAVERHFQGARVEFLRHLSGLSEDATESELMLASAFDFVSGFDPEAAKTITRVIRERAVSRTSSDTGSAGRPRLGPSTIADQLS